MTLRYLLAGVLLAASWVTTTNAQAAVKRTIDIPSQGLGEALTELARSTGIQLVYPARLVQGLKAPSLQGFMTPEDALAQLLARTSLRFEFIEPQTVTLSEVKASGQQADDASALNVGGAAGALRVAETEAAAADAAQTSAQPEEPRMVVDESGRATPEMLIRGRRTTNADIERTENDVQPYVVFERAQIQRSMSSSVEDFLKTRLPMNTVQNSNEQSVNALGNQSEINLRGLGANQTLILMDGRQLPAVNRAGTFAQPDINGIPLAAIERIEVLPSTASGIYGGGATGGVINIITRKDYVGGQLGVTYDNEFDANAAGRRVDGSWGSNFNEGRTHVIISGSYSETDPLLIGDRDFVDRARTLQLQNNPAAFLGALPPAGATTNIRSQNGSNLVLDNGTPLNSPITFIPAGYAGRASDNGAALFANAGRYNLSLSDDAGGYQRSLVNNPTTQALSLNLTQEFGDRVEAFLDGSRYENRGLTETGLGTQTATIPGNAPNNPFTTAINVSFPAAPFSYVNRVDSTTTRVLGGVLMRLPRKWTIAADHAWSRSENNFSHPQTFISPTLTGAIQNGTVDVLRDVNLYAADFLSNVMPTRYDFGSSEIQLRDTNLRLSGPAFEMPAGPLVLSALLEHRKDEAPTSLRETPKLSGSVTRYIQAREQTVNTYYLEARVPLVSERNHLPWVHALELQASTRGDEFDRVVPVPQSFDLATPNSPRPSINYIGSKVKARKETIGFSYAPTRDVMFRASYGSGFLPPAIDQLVPLTEAPLTLALSDPKRGSISTDYTIQHGRLANANLQPEESKSWSLGMIFTPRCAPTLRFSLDYTHIDKENEIAFFNAQNLLNLEDLLPPGRITRAPLTPQDSALGYTGGVITAMDTSFINLSTTSVRAYDTQLDYSLDVGRLGKFSLYVVATRMSRFERQVSPLAMPTDSVGFSSGPLQWRGNGGIYWERGGWAAGWDTQYYDSYRVYASNATPTVANAAILNQGAAEIPSQIYHDIYGSYRFKSNGNGLRGVLDSLEVRLRVQNVLNQSPPILVTTGATGGYSTYGNPRLRRYSIALSKSF